ncbi:ABC transporter substrate-binding protein [Cyanobacterium aponinum]|uniref:ABC transporter substrate-binding protein n=1 Tax=Cyanobacterium aponinum TaxID=379064 RepID=UPI0009FC7ABE
MYFGRDKIHIDAKNSFAGLILEDAGLKRPDSQNQDAPYGALPISLEELNKADGDILFVTTYSDDGTKILEEIKNNPLWQNLKAVKFDRVYYVNFMAWGASHILGTDGVIDDLFKYLGNIPS